jgi:hypothetical protein
MYDGAENTCAPAPTEPRHKNAAVAAILFFILFIIARGKSVRVLLIMYARGGENVTKIALRRKRGGVLPTVKKDLHLSARLLHNIYAGVEATGGSLKKHL